MSIAGCTVTEMLCKLLCQQAAPEVNVEVFNGSPLNFQCFMLVFKDVIETKLDYTRWGLIRLIKCTSGKTKKL